MEYVAIRENIGRAGAGQPHPRRRGLRREHPRLRHPRIRPRRGRPRPRDHPQQHQPPRIRADGDRPQLPGQDQRQYRQLRGRIRRRGRSRQDGLVDPLGRRHGHGPLHRPQHPRHPRMDHPQFARPDRHRADLSGAGKSRRRRRGPHLGNLPRHADRAGRTGRRLLHHPRRRAPALHPDDRQARHRHRQPRRQHHGQMVPGAPQGELPLRTLRRDHRDHEGVRHRLFARRRPAPRHHRRRQRRSPVRRALHPGRADQARLGAGCPGDDRGPRPRADAQDQGEYGQAARGLRRGAVLHARARSPPTSRPATITSPAASAPR